MKKTTNSKLTTHRLVDDTSTQPVIESRHSSSGNTTFTNSSSGTAAAFLGQRLFLLSVLLLTTFAASVGNAQAQSAVVSGNVYRLRNQCSNKVLDVFGGNTSDGTAAIQWTEHDGSNQQFKVEATDSGYYRLVAQHSQKVLDVQYSQTADGTQVWQYTSNNTAAQQWKITTSSSDGYSRVESRLASNKVLDVSGSSTADGARVQLWTSNNTCAQRWKFELVGGGAAPTPTPTATEKVRVYEHGEYAGRWQELGVGVYNVEQLGEVGNDAISSLKIPVGLQAKVCEHTQAGGECRVFAAGETSYVGDGWNDRISYVEVSVAPGTEAGLVKMLYTSDFTTNFANPERGFYIQAAYGVNNQNGRGLSLKTVHRTWTDKFEVQTLEDARAAGITMIRMYYIIPYFRQRDLDTAFLNTFEQHLITARRAGMKVMPLFAVSFPEFDSKDTRPIAEKYADFPDASYDQVIKYIDQLEPYIKRNADVIASWDTGFVGAWGEWHHSTSGVLTGEYGNQPTELSKNIVKRLLQALPPGRMITMRTPWHQYAQNGSRDPLTVQEAFSGTEKARIGAKNDCFLSDATDQGTYLNLDFDKAFLRQNNLFVPQGGETCDNGGVEQNYNSCAIAVRELANLRYSTLNWGYFEGTLNRWEREGCMSEIQRRMGYRFRLLESNVLSAVRPGAELKLNFTLTNDGWAAPYNPRPLEVRLRHKSSGQVLRLRLSGNRSNHEDPRFWLPNDGDQSKSYTVSVTAGVPTSAATGEYEVEVALPDPEASLSGDARYSIRMANAGGVWRSETGSNSLQQAVQVTASASGNSYTGSQWFE